MDFSSDMVKGSIVPIVLSLLAERTMYGYEMVKEVNRRSNGALNWKEGTLYPTLHRLEAERLIRSQWHEPAGANADSAAKESTSGGRQRKYYLITGKGRRELSRRTRQWRDFSRAVNAVMFGRLEPLRGGAA